MVVFLVKALCNLVQVFQHFRGCCCLHHQHDEVIVYIHIKKYVSIMNFLAVINDSNASPVHIHHAIVEIACDCCRNLHLCIQG
jgi:hypothetical protein